MKILYTDAALQELRAFQDKQKEMLEEHISERKYVYGDDTVEITASDIKETSQRIRIYRPQDNRYYSLNNISHLYIAIGVLISMGGFLYPKLQYMFSENPIQAVSVLTGMFMVFLGFFAKYLYRIRMQKSMEMEKRFRERNEKNST